MKTPLIPKEYASLQAMITLPQKSILLRRTAQMKLKQEIALCKTRGLQCKHPNKFRIPWTQVSRLPTMCPCGGKTLCGKVFTRVTRSSNFSLSNLVPSSDHQVPLVTNMETETFVVSLNTKTTRRTTWGVGQNAGITPFRFHPEWKESTVTRKRSFTITNFCTTLYR